MIKTLKDDNLINKLGGRFKLTALVNKRFRELIQGSRPAVTRERGMTDLETIMQEVEQDKLGIDYEQSDITEVDKLIR